MKNSLHVASRSSLVHSLSPSLPFSNIIDRFMPLIVPISANTLSDIPNDYLTRSRFFYERMFLASTLVTSIEIACPTLPFLITARISSFASARAYNTTRVEFCAIVGEAI